MPANPRDYCYDVESYPNVFLCTVKHIASGQRWIFEISDQINQATELYVFLTVSLQGARMVGFNNLHYDYPVLHFFIQTYQRQGFVTAAQLYAKTYEIINGNERFNSEMIWPSDFVVEQLDLLKIHHFDNVNKRTSLKVLEFNMRSDNVSDLPFPPGTILDRDQIRILLNYNCHDVNETIRFYGHSLPMIEFRDELSKKYGKDFTNHNDTKIGKDYFIMKLEESGVPCFVRTGGRKQPRQTPRRSIPLQSVIFPYIAFQRPEFDRLLTYLKSVTLTDTNKPPELEGLSVEVNGFAFDIRAGGIHGSVKKTTIRADQDHEIIDVDVTGFYPNLAVMNRVYPEHLSELFCDIYADVIEQRSQHNKKSSIANMLKLAANGVYGDSNNPYSPFLDPAYTMTITINGQLLQLMLAEWWLQSPHISMIQANTDGMTVRVHRDGKAWFDQCCKQWQDFTRLKLEFANYSAMFIRDVNSYMAVKTDGTIKRIGAYTHETQAENIATRELWWNKDWSALVVPKAVQAVLVDGADLTQFIYNHPDPYDFMLRVKVKRSDRLVASISGVDEPLPNITRYHVATTGPYLFKIMPPLASKGPDAPIRRFSVEKGWPVRVCNWVADFDWSILDRSYYIKEAEKLLRMEGGKEK